MYLRRKITITRGKGVIDLYIDRTNGAEGKYVEANICITSNIHYINVVHYKDAKTFSWDYSC